MRRGDVAGGRAHHVAGSNGIAFLAQPIDPLARYDEEHLLVDVVRVARKRLLARRHDMKLATELARADSRTDATELGDKLRAIAAIAQIDVGDIDDWLRHPTLPSRLMAISFCASTANSIGSCWSTSRTKPLTISAVASSPDSPRCRQ